MSFPTLPTFPLRHAHLVDLSLRVPQVIPLGGSVGGERRLAAIEGGIFSGERLYGEVLAGGNDLQLVRTDDVVEIDARVALRTNDGASIALVYRGIRHASPDVQAKLAAGDEVDPTAYYFRISAQFATSHPAYAWLNHRLAIGVGHRRRDGPVYSLYEVL